MYLVVVLVCIIFYVKRKTAYEMRISDCSSDVCSSDLLKALIATLILAVLFTALQIVEYTHAPFTIADGVYGSTFYMATGFHGFHVFIGTCFLFVCAIRLYLLHFTQEHHFGFEAAAWFWHFVDVVWLFLFFLIYCDWKRLV